MQRTLRNVLENRREQRDAEEKACGNLLLLKEQLRDEQEMEQELVCASVQPEHTSLFVFRVLITKGYMWGKAVLCKSEKCEYD